MTKIEAVIRPRKLDSVKKALIAIGVEGITVCEVRGYGHPKPAKHALFQRPADGSDLLPRIKLELVLNDEMAARAIHAIQAHAYTGVIGDGKIFVYRIDNAVRIRNAEDGPAAIS